MSQSASASQLKSEGDEAFRARRFDAADAAYSEALREANDDEGLATLHLNRYASHLPCQHATGFLIAVVGAGHRSSNCAGGIVLGTTC